MMHKYGADYTNTFRALTFDKLSDMELFDTKPFAEWHKQWKARLSRQQETKDSSHELMKSSNPAIIPRNHRVEEALEAAEKGDYSVMERFLMFFQTHTPTLKNNRITLHCLENLAVLTEPFAVPNKKYKTN